MAVNSGLVAFPTGYTRVFQQEGIALWRPTPPPGYVALGCVAVVAPTSGAGLGGGAGPAPGAGDAPAPPLRAVVVVHERAVVEALLAECMLLNANGNLWCVQNSVGTFEVAPADAHQPQVRFSVRTCVGVLVEGMREGRGSCTRIPPLQGVWLSVSSMACML